MPPRDGGVSGPAPAAPADVDELNRVFSDAFTERYHRDGMRSVRVPLLNPAVWRYAFAVAGDGAMIWRDGSGAIAAFNMVHLSGAEGWMGPLAVRTDLQGRGLGRRIVTAGIEQLRRQGAQVIGLETMPRTVENIGFYSGLGFRPGHLTISMGREVLQGDAMTPAATLDAATVDACRALTARVRPGADYSREIALTRRLDVGDLTVVETRGELAAFALWHRVPLAPSRTPDDLRILKLVAVDLGAFGQLLEALAGVAKRLRLERVSIRCETRATDAYAELLAAGYKVHWTDLRMSLEGHREPEIADGVAFSNWEI